MLNLSTIPMQRIFSAISTLNLWKLANCIVECFNQKDYTIYANCKKVHLKELWRNLAHKMSTNSVSSTQSLTLIPQKSSYRCWQSHITVSNKVKAWVIHVAGFSRKTNRSGPSYQRSCPWPRLFCSCQQQMPALNMPSVP